jgi:hypothetical protein
MPSAQAHNAAPCITLGNYWRCTVATTNAVTGMTLTAPVLKLIVAWCIAAIPTAYAQPQPTAATYRQSQDREGPRSGNSIITPFAGGASD